MLGVRDPTLLQPCSLFASMYHHINKAYGINISLPPYSNMFVVLTYLKSTYVFDCLQHLLLWTGYKQVENYKTRQVLLIHQLVLIC
jgi:hypothetical protein